MSTRRLLIESIRHYWRTHLGVILGSALATLVLTGALMVGDSVKATLRAQAEARVGKIGEALLCGERFVPWTSAVEKRPSVVAPTFLAGRDAAGVLLLPGTAARSDGTARANKVQIIGVDDAFWKLSPSGNDPFAHGDRVDSGRAGLQPAVPGTLPGTEANAIALNERLAAQLGVKPGDEVLLRFEKPSAFSKDAPLSGEDEGSVSLRLRIARVLGDADFGRFALVSGQVPPHTAFVPHAALQEKLGVGQKVNLVLNRTRRGEGTRQPRREPFGNWFRGLFEPRYVSVGKLVVPNDESSPAESEPGLLEAFEIKVQELPKNAGFELRTPRIFLEQAIVEAARANESGSAGVPPAVPGRSPGTPGVAKPQERETLSANERNTAPDASRDTREAGSGTPALPRGLDSLTYFVNELRAGDGSDAKANATPYSMVTAIDAPASGFIQAELADDEIQINSWLADDLGVGPGDKVTIKYFVMGERRQLVEKARAFTVLAPILEMDEPQLNGSWMPDFPGLADKENCRDWKPGFDFDATRMRDKDQDYWSKYRGTPKAFVNLRAGQEMWGNRWGNLTSIRYPAPATRGQVERIAAFIDPAALGFRVVNLREQALAATKAPVDFGELFVYFSFFLIAAAAVLTGLLFTFTIEQRAAEAGLLLAIGWPAKKVRLLFLREGFVLALIGSLAGTLLAALYTKGVLHALAGVWGGATGGTRFIFAPSAVTMAIGVGSGVLVALIAMWLASRKLFKMEAAALLNGEWAEPAGGHAVRNTGFQPAVADPQQDTAGWKSAGRTDRMSVFRRAARFLSARASVFWFAAASVVAALALSIFAKGNSGAFFGAGALLLIAGCLFSLAAMRRVAGATGAESLSQLGARNVSRRRGRSLATIAVLASGVFMVIAVDSFRKGAPEDSERRDSGTGGFAFIGESSAPIYEDLNTAKGREAYALDDKLMSGVRVVQMRVRDGDDASCLNLNRAGQPRILGVDLSGRAGFQPAVPGILPGTSGVEGSPKSKTPSANDPQPAPSANERNSAPGGPGRIPGPAGKIPALPAGDADAMRNRFGLDWSSIVAKDSTAVPGVVDANTLQWAMQKKLGDVIEIPGERGEPARIEIAATVPGSVLQGLIIIPERDFTANFPNTAGYRFFLIDCPREKMDAVREHLTRQLGDLGLELVPAVKRLAEFNEVENTYLSIFQVLGGLGMLLGSAGLGIVVARNVFERRREFGLLEAVGFTPGLLRRLVFAEHRWLILGAVGIGAVSALVAVWPRLASQSSGMPWRGIGILILGMVALGAFWAWFATRLALRSSQLAALRTE